MSSCLPPAITKILARLSGEWIPPQKWQVGRLFSLFAFMLIGAVILLPAITKRTGNVRKKIRFKGDFEMIPSQISNMSFLPLNNFFSNSKKIITSERLHRIIKSYCNVNLIWYRNLLKDWNANIWIHSIHFSIDNLRLFGLNGLTLLPLAMEQFEVDLCVMLRCRWDLIGFWLVWKRVCCCCF